MLEEQNQTQTPPPLPPNMYLPWERPADTATDDTAERLQDAVDNGPVDRDSPQVESVQGMIDEEAAPEHQGEVDAIDTSIPEASEGELPSAEDQEPAEDVDDAEGVEDEPAPEPASNEEIEVHFKDSHRLRIRDKEGNLVRVVPLSEYTKSMTAAAETRKRSEEGLSFAKQVVTDLGPLLAHIAKTNPEARADALSELKRGEAVRAQLIDREQKAVVHRVSEEHWNGDFRQMRNDLQDAARTALSKYKKHGLTAEMISGIQSPALLLILRDLHQFHSSRDAIAEKKISRDPQRVRKPTAKRRNGSRSRNSRQVQTERQRLRQSGDPKDAAALLTALGLG